MSFEKFISEPIKELMIEAKCPNCIPINRSKTKYEFACSKCHKYFNNCDKICPICNCKGTGKITKTPESGDVGRIV